MYIYREGKEGALTSALAHACQPRTAIVLAQALLQLLAMKQYCILFTCECKRYAEYVRFDDCPGISRAHKWFRLKRGQRILEEKYGKSQLVFFFKRRRVVLPLLQQDDLTGQSRSVPMWMSHDTVHDHGLRQADDGLSDRQLDDSW